VSGAAIPAGDVTIVAPTDEAFAAVLTELDITAEELLASPDLPAILALHIIGGETAVSGGAADITAKKVEVEGADAAVSVTKGPSCDGYQVLVASEVLLPGAAEVPAPAPAPAGSGTITVGALVDQLCPDIKTALRGADFTILSTAITALSTAEVGK
jgi:hypothetical protein